MTSETHRSRACRGRTPSLASCWPCWTGTGCRRPPQAGAPCSNRPSPSPTPPFGSHLGRQTRWWCPTHRWLPPGRWSWGCWRLRAAPPPRHSRAPSGSGRCPWLLACRPARSPSPCWGPGPCSACKAAGRWTGWTAGRCSEATPQSPRRTLLWTPAAPARLRCPSSSSWRRRPPSPPERRWTAQTRRQWRRCPPAAVCLQVEQEHRPMTSCHQAAWRCSVLPL